MIIEFCLKLTFCNITLRNWFGPIRIRMMIDSLKSSTFLINLLIYLAMILSMIYLIKNQDTVVGVHCIQYKVDVTFEL